MGGLGRDRIIPDLEIKTHRTKTKKLQNIYDGQSSTLKNI
jgi:hypothetical protein